MTLNDRFLEAQKNIKLALERSGRNQTVEIVAATKTQKPNTIKETIECGSSSVGETRIQEAEKKFINLKSINKRFIGHLQSNKVNKCLELFDTIDSIHSLKIAKRISNRINVTKKNIECLIEVNTSRDENKKGFEPKNLSEMIDCINIENLNVCGLMTLGPQSQNPKDTRASFALLRKTMKTINKQTPARRLTELSMGMSGDYMVAVEEGSTMVRLGTTLYGPRKKV